MGKKSLPLHTLVKSRSESDLSADIQILAYMRRAREMKICDI